MVTCSTCGNEYERIGQHWGVSCPYPDLTDKQEDILTGLMMGDGSARRNGKSSLIQVQMINKEYLEYVDSMFPKFGCDVRMSKDAEASALENRKSGFRENAKEENYSDVYRWFTRTGPMFDKYVEWYTDGGKYFPESLSLTPTVLKHWFCCDGHYASRYNCVKISCSNERNNKRKIKSYFSEAGLPEPSRWEESTTKRNEHRCSVAWTSDDAKQMFDYMGSSIPGFEHKWPDRKI